MDGMLRLGYAPHQTFALCVAASSCHMLSPSLENAIFNDWRRGRFAIGLVLALQTTGIRVPEGRRERLRRARPPRRVREPYRAADAAPRASRRRAGTVTWPRRLALRT
ncbi:hypothetical protein GCM10010182_60620 [Actinomadura cremea]|nr:hypothetical protein GCM10010182_60620 [Actinomadura cremea]